MKLREQGNKSKSQYRKYLVKKLDDITSLIVRLQGNDTCVVCGSKESPTNGHLFSRDTYSTRWDVHEGGNCSVQCWPCNYKHEHNAGPYTSWYIKKFGIDKYDELSSRRVSRPWKEWELIEKFEELNKIYDNLLKNSH